MHKNFELAPETIQMYMDMAKENEHLEKIIEDGKVNVEELRLKCDQNDNLIMDLNMELEEGQRYNDFAEKKITRSESAMKKIAGETKRLIDYVKSFETERTELEGDLTIIRDLSEHIRRNREFLRQKQDEFKIKEKQDLEEKTQRAKYCEEEIANNNLKIENIKQLLKLKDDKIEEKRNYYLQLQNQLEMKKEGLQALQYRNITKLTEEIEEQDKINEDLKKKINATSDANDELERKNIDSANSLKKQMATVIAENKTEREANIKKMKELRVLLKKAQLEKSEPHYSKMRKSETFAIPQRKPSNSSGSSLTSFSEQVPDPSTVAARTKPFNIRGVKSMGTNYAIPQDTKMQSTSKLHLEKQTESPRNYWKQLVCPIKQISPGSSETSLEFPPNFEPRLSRHTPFTSLNTRHNRPIIKHYSMTSKIEDKIKGKKATQPTIYSSNITELPRNLARQTVQSLKSSEASYGYIADPLTILSRPKPFTFKNIRPIIADISVTEKDQEIKRKEAAQRAISVREKVILSPGSSDSDPFSLSQVPQRDTESSQHNQFFTLLNLNLGSNGQKKN